MRAGEPVAAGTARSANGADPHAPAAPDPTRIFDVPVQTAEPADMLRRILGWAAAGEHRRVSYVNAHVINRSFEIPELRRALLGADLVYCDGYGVRLAAKAIGLSIPHRMTGADWIWALAPLCQQAGLSVYLLGSDPGISARAAATLRRWYPRLEVCGTHHGYFDDEGAHNDRVLEHIAGQRPDVLLVGMGTPRQELWVERNFDRVEANLVWTVGALFDYVSGRTPRAPHWMADHGLEWIFRLGVEPRRMWRRYLLGNPVFLRRVFDAWRSRGGADAGRQPHG